MESNIQVITDKRSNIGGVEFYQVEIGSRDGLIEQQDAVTFVKDWASDWLAERSDSVIITVEYAVNDDDPDEYYSNLRICNRWSITLVSY